MFPPAPDSPVPTESVIDPPAPPLEAPLDNTIDPEFFVGEVPVVISTLPLPSLLPAFFDSIITRPDAPSTEEPDDSVISPPVAVVLVPATTDMSPPIP